MKELKLFIQEQSNELAMRLLEEMLAGNAVAVANPHWPKRFTETIVEVIDPTVVVIDKVAARRVANTDVPEHSSLVANTSGTSGLPKGICHSWANLEASAKASLSYLGANKGEGLWINALPINHVGGFTTITKSYFANHRLETLGSFDYATFDEIARRSDAPVFTSLVKANLSKLDLSVFEKILLGAGTPPSKRPVNAVVTYGLTETGSGCVYDGVALLDVVIQVVEGEVLLKGPMIAQSYRNGTPLTDTNGFFHTGDSGSLGDDGLLSVTGRISEVINTGGEKVAPNTVEEVINEATDLPEYAIFGCRDEEFGEVVAVAIAHHEESRITLESLQQIVAEKLPRYCIPRRLFAVDTLPKTDLGKVQRKRLTEIFSTAR